MTGSLAPGTTALVTYTVAIRGDGERGDNTLDNVLLPDNPDACAGSVCETTHPVGELDVWKSVDPGSGALVSAGDVLTYTLHFENTGEAPVGVDYEDVLDGVLDDAQLTSAPASSVAAITTGDLTDGRVRVTGTLAPGETATVTYQVTVNADGSRGDDRLGNFLVPTGDEPRCDTDERTCTVNPVSVVTVVKSSDPVSRSTVKDGDRVQYTLTFTNTSTSPDASPAPVSFVDHMRDVLDDAVLEGEPSASVDTLTVEVAEDRLTVDGLLDAGETATVTYVVEVKAYADQGNHRLANVVALAGDDPVCVPDTGLCTEHPTVPPTLSRTGGEVQMVIVVFATLFIVSGAAALLVGRRKNATRSLSAGNG
ncbi:DUF11 domain-containing protein [Microbacterium sp. Leaf320]|uniref:DUF11 domain-containing protein n=1 Tax=Microbacterium sp. Leaf320 TaxID=1736334 RepID=UPI001F2FEBFB|nr:DUF11 domain-containing protein [Microbacterium sp. Leaf320]